MCFYCQFFRIKGYLIEDLIRGGYVIKKIPKKPKFKTPILFVHGAWHGAWCWENFIDYFGNNGFSCYELDLPCHGKRRDEPGP